MSIRVRCQVSANASSVNSHHGRPVHRAPRAAPGARFIKILAAPRGLPQRLATPREAVVSRVTVDRMKCVAGWGPGRIYLAKRPSAAPAVAAVLMVIWGQGCATAPPQHPIFAVNAGMHTASIRSIAVHENTNTLVTGGDDKTARVWSLKTVR